MMTCDNTGLFAHIVERAEELYFSALEQYRENRAHGRFEKARIALNNAREFAKFVRSAKRNLAKAQAKLAAMVCDEATCPECQAVA